MRRYIDADKLKDNFCDACATLKRYGRTIEECRNKTDSYGNKCFKMRLIDAMPTSDVVEVRHSQIKWVNRPISAQYATVTDENGEKHYVKVCDCIENNPVGYCGECGKRLDVTFMKYCPNCGAKMDGERSENGK